MKKLIYVLLISLGWSCSDFLNVNPKAEIVDEDLFATESGVEDALYGAYVSLRSSEMYGQCMSVFVPEILSQSFQPTSSSLFRNMGLLDYEDSFVRERTDEMWKFGYQAIGYINNIIIHLREKDRGSLKNYDLYLGEAVGLRAFVHFDLLRYFAVHIGSVDEAAKAKAIPYVTTYSFNSTPFSSVEEVYKKIIDDLKEAETLLAKDEVYLTSKRGEEADGFFTARETHFNLYAAQAMLARVYWMKGDLAQAKVYAQKVIDAKKFSFTDKTKLGALMQGYLSFEETIFGVYSRNFPSVMFTTFCKSGDRSLVLRKDWEELYETNEGPTPEKDFRLTSWYGEDPDEGETCLKLVNYKFKEDPNNFNDPVCLGINLIRIPEMYYILAEAYLKEDIEKATYYMDEVISARGMRKYKDREPAQELTLDDILLERRKEYVGEGQEWFSMKRLNKDIVSLVGKKTIPGSDKAYTFPLPAGEVDYRNN